MRLDVQLDGPARRRLASAILPGGVALFMIVESGARWLNPVPIRFNQAIVDAVPVAPPPGKCIHT